MVVRALLSLSLPIVVLAPARAELPPLPASMQPMDFLADIAWSHDGTRVAAAGDDGAVRVYAVGKSPSASVPIAELVASPADHERAKALRPGRGSGAYMYTLDDVSGVAFLPGDERVVVAGEDEHLRVWSIAERRVVAATFWGPYQKDDFDGGITALALAADGSRVAAASWDGTARTWLCTPVGGGAPTSWPLERGFIGHGQGVRDVALSPDGKLLATASNDGTAGLWQVADGQRIATLAGHRSVVTAVAFSPDGKLLATGSDGLSTFNDDIGSKTTVDANDLVQPDAGVKVFALWSVPAGKRVFADSFDVDEVTTLAFAPDGKRVYAGIFDNGNGHAVLVIDIDKTKSRAQVVGRYLSHPGNIAVVRPSPDGTRLAVNDKADVVILNALTGAELERFAAPAPPSTPAPR